MPPELDLGRIIRILSLIKNYWLSHPELRLGQLLINAIPPELADLYYVTDESLEIAIREMAKREQP